MVDTTGFPLSEAVRVLLAAIAASLEGGSGAVATAAAPAYDEGSTAPLSMDLAGALRVLATIDTTGLATAANQATGNTSLATLVTQGSDNSAVNIYPFPTTPVSGFTTSMTGTASTAVTGMGAPGANLYNYITDIIISNTDADTGTLVEIQDGDGGTSFIPNLQAPFAGANNIGGSTHHFTTPIKQPTANTALYAKNTTTGAAVIVTVVGFQAAPV